MPAENTALIVLLFVFILFVLLFCVGASRLNRRRYAQKTVSSAKGEHAWKCGNKIIDSDCHQRDKPPHEGCHCIVYKHKTHQVEHENEEKKRKNMVKRARDTLDKLMRSYSDQGSRSEFPPTAGSLGAAPAASAVAGAPQYAAIEKETKAITSESSHETY